MEGVALLSLVYVATDHGHCSTGYCSLSSYSVKNNRIKRSGSRIGSLFIGHVT